MYTRRHLLTTGLGLTTGLAGCLADHSGAAGKPPGGKGDDSTMDEPVSIRNGGLLDVTIESNIATPRRVRVEAASEITLTVTNQTAVRHTIVGAPVGLENPLVIPAGVTQSELWRTPSRPGTGRLRCRDHDTRVVAVQIVPADVSGGCPTG